MKKTVNFKKQFNGEKNGEIKRRINAALVFTAAVLFLVSCLPVFAAPYDSGDNTVKELNKELKHELSKWRGSIIKHRKQKDVYFKTSPTSPMAASQRLLVKNGTEADRVYLNRKDRHFSITEASSPGSLVALVKQKDKWTWKRIADGITCTMDKKDIPEGAVLPSNCFINSGNCKVKVYDTKDGLVLVVFDPLRPEIQHFNHLLYFPPNPGFRVKATLKKFSEIKTMTVTTSQNLEKKYYRYAAIHFKLNGKDVKLTAFKFNLEGEGSDYLFIPFADATSGKESYEVGRFLDLPEPKKSEFILDLNLCYNPLCNYSPAYNCPIPPIENELDVPIKAGEKAYPH
jgi:uncharacterized protein